MSDHIFISHATADDDFVKQLRIKLELHDLTVWVDSRNLRGGDQLKPEIEQAIQSAKHVLVVLSPKTMNSTWVRDEIQLAEKIAKEKDNYRVIPLMLPGVEPAALTLWFKEEPAGIKIQLETGQLQQKLPEILAALGERLSDDVEPAQAIIVKPIAELLLELSRTTLRQQEDGSMQLSAEAQLESIPAEPTQDSVHSKPFRFIAPIGQIEQDDLRWYLESYPHWPTGLFQKRAKAIEARLPQWGQALFDAVLTTKAAEVVVTAWEEAKTDSERRFSIRIKADTLDEEQQDIALQAASKLISLPWELLRAGKHWLSDGANPVRIRRRLPNYQKHAPLVAEIPIRILLLSPRPEQEGVGYIDHRASAQPLVDAVAALGDLVELTVLTPPTLSALQQELKRAKGNHQPYHVVHFDGHGVYNPQYSLGALCFEHPKDSHKLEQRAMQLVYAKYDKDTPDSHNANIASLLKDYRIPLVFLEACQTPQSDINPNASVAASLLKEGVASVVAMSHSVLVKTATIFVTAFYQALAHGQRVGQAMLAGQNALKQTSYRFPILGAGELHLQDWFVPILYQEKHDPQMFQHIPSAKAESLAQQQQHARLGKLPATPNHSFIGRSRELLSLERMLENQPYAVIAGQGGMGKTTLSIELARWLVRSGRFDRCAFVSLEEYSHDRAVLDELGRQLVGDQYSVAEYGDDLKTALQPIQRVLENKSCLLLLDNMESLLADSNNLDAVLGLINTLLPVGWVERSETQQSPKTRLLFTTRESLPAPFNHATRHVTLSELSETDAKALIMRVMAQQGLDLKHDDQGRTPQEVNALVNAVGRHARALVLLAQQLAIQGVTATTENLQSIMQELENQHPGQREYSLYASVELSLQRLSAESRKMIKGLAVLHDGGEVQVIAHILDIEVEAARQLSTELIQVGLAEEKAYAYFRLDPALPNYLALQLQDEEKQHYRLRWSEVISQLVDFLLQQRSQDTKLQAQLTQLELPNLMAFIRSLNQQLQADQAEAETVTGKAGSIEQLLANLDYPQALAEVVSIRQQASERLGEWSHARFESERLTIERLLAQGEIPAAFEAAQILLQQCEQAGVEAYSGADYDLAIANFLLVFNCIN